jgi:NTP pyrophosphatase (non-canonical NTP hydrolase)
MAESHVHHLKSNAKEGAVLRPEVEVFAREMERALRKNDHKPGWKMDEPAALLARLREETDELEQAIRDVSGARDDLHLDGGPLWWKVIEEAADVANFALMIADLASRSSIFGLEDLHRLRERMEMAAK